jgi:hypothetical protein
MSLITCKKEKNTHKPRYCEKEKDKANKRNLRSLALITMAWSSLAAEP